MRTFQTAFNSVIRYRQSALHHHGLAKEKKEVTFEQLQADNKKTQYKIGYPLPKRFLRYNKTLNYFKVENKLYRHD